MEDMIKYLRKDTEDLENNQQEIGMQCSLRGFPMKALDRACVSDNKHTVHERIINQNFMSHCCKFQKERNEKIHGKDTQRKRVIEWKK